MKRWKRAEKLKLNPPLEVLAVLLKEDAKNNPKVQRAYIDELMTSKYVID
jgi:DNA polymerase delta subunit 4